MKAKRVETVFEDSICCFFTAVILTCACKFGLQQSTSIQLQGYGARAPSKRMSIAPNFSTASVAITEPASSIVRNINDPNQDCHQAVELDVSYCVFKHACQDATDDIIISWVLVLRFETDFKSFVRLSSLNIDQLQI